MPMVAEQQRNHKSEFELRNQCFQSLGSQFLIIHGEALGWSESPRGLGQAVSWSVAELHIIFSFTVCPSLHL